MTQQSTFKIMHCNNPRPPSNVYSSKVEGLRGKMVIMITADNSDRAALRVLNLPLTCKLAHKFRVVHLTAECTKLGHSHVT